MISTSDLINRIRILLNEPASNDVPLNLIQEDDRSINEHISVLLPQSVSFVQMYNDKGGDVNRKKANISVQSVVDVGDGCGYVVLPSDYVSLITLRMAGWDRACSEAFSSSSPIALAQSNVYTRNGSCSPVSIEDYSADGMRILRYYSLPMNKRHEVEVLLYEANFNRETGLCCEDDKLISAVVHKCASMLYDVFEKHENAMMFNNTALLLCGVNNVITNNVTDENV